MPLVGIAWGARRLSWQQAKSESEAGQLPFPVPLLNAMQDTRNDETPSASVIAGCLRQFELKKRTEYYERPQDLLAPLFGTAFHSHMEKYTEVDAPELEDYTPGGGYTMTKGGPRHKELLLSATLDLGIPGYEATKVMGRCDYLHEGHLIRDWKTKRYIAQGHVAPPEARVQVNIYNWLASESGYKPATHGELAYVSNAWSQPERFELRPVALTRKYVLGRLKHWASYVKQGQLPPPHPAFFMAADAKGRMPAPCGFCPVREACLEAYRQEEEAPF